MKGALAWADLGVGGFVKLALAPAHARWERLVE